MKKDQKSVFLQISCSRCGRSQVVFGRGTTRIKCGKCNKLLVKPTGGKTRIRSLVRRVYHGA